MRHVIMPESFKEVYKGKQGFLSKVTFLYKGEYRKKRDVFSATDSSKQIMYMLKKFYMKDMNPNHYRDVDIQTYTHFYKDEQEMFIERSKLF